MVASRETLQDIAAERQLLRAFDHPSIADEGDLVTTKTVVYLVNL